jgi:hypothetical protein
MLTNPFETHRRRRFVGCVQAQPDVRGTDYYAEGLSIGRGRRRKHLKLRILGY